MERLFLTFTFSATFCPTPAQKTAQTLVNIILVSAQIVIIGFLFGLGFNLTS